MSSPRRHAAAILDEARRRQVLGLLAAAEAHDGCRPELYLDTASSGQYPAHFFADDPASGELVGYLGLLVFGPETTEIVGVVAPAARRRGVFSALLADADQVCRAIGIDTVALLVPASSDAGRGLARARGAQLVDTEHRMLCEQPGVVEPASDLALDPAKSADAELLAALDAASFGSDAALMRRRYREILDAPDRRAWILRERGAAVGKIHARCGERAVVHDLCITPKARGRGLGRAMVSLTVRALLGGGARHVVLDVSASNTSALRVYRRCGFRTIERHEFWRGTVLPK